ncbi:MAG: LPS assembly lipoprotein LptE [Xanthobacteraceae bacterium]
MPSLTIRLARLALTIAIAATTAGCFEPLYGDRTTLGGPNVKAALTGVEVMQIPAANGSPESRLAVEVRNKLLFDFGTDTTPVKPTHQLRIRLSSTRLSVIVDVTTARPDVENYGLNATYELVDLRTNKVVVNDTTMSRVSVDVPGQQQRFARQRGLRDAETRAAETIAESIRNRLASYFTAGT